MVPALAAYTLDPSNNLFSVKLVNHTQPGCLHDTDLINKHKLACTRMDIDWKHWIQKANLILKILSNTK